MNKSRTKCRTIRGGVSTAYSYCSGWAGCEPCRGWRGCGNGRFEGPTAPAEAHDLSFQGDWDETKEGEKPTASPEFVFDFRGCEGKRRLEGGMTISEVRGEESPDAGGEVLEV